MNVTYIQDLLIEFNSSIPLNPDYFKTKRLKEKRKMNQGNQNSSQMNLIIIKKAIPFIFDFKILRSLLIVSKKFQKEITNKVMEQILIKIPIQMPLEIKIKLWKFILHSNSSNQDINNSFDFSKVDKKSEEDISGMINKDVLRSYTHIKKINPTILENVLKAYALSNPEIGYCQGMNYIVGFLSLIFPEEEEVLKSFAILMNDYQLKQMYNHSMSFVKFCFFILDKLISFYFQDFKVELKYYNIGSSQFLSPWFLTLFCTILQHSNDTNIPKFLQSILDIFLIQKWKGLFKIALYLISLITDEKHHFNKDLLSLMCDILKDEKFTFPEYSENLKVKVQLWKITNSMLEQMFTKFKELNPQDNVSLIQGSLNNLTEEKI